MICPFCQNELISRKKAGEKGWRRHFCLECGSFIQESPKAIAMEVSDEILRLNPIKEKEGGKNERGETKRGEPRDEEPRGTISRPGGILRELDEALKRKH